MLFKKIAKLFAPPIVYKCMRIIRNRGNFYGIDGNFSSYQDAEKYLQREGKGDYTDPKILKQVLGAIKAVRRGEAVFERDGVLFDKAEYNYPLLCTLFKTICSCKKNDTLVNILDFGGSLGSTYFQNKYYLHDLCPFSWHICEQTHYVDLGKKEIPEIKFHKNIDEYILAGNSCDILLLSGVIQYFDDPYAWLEKLLRQPFRFIIIDRTFLHSADDRLGIQYVPPSIYDGSYPAWLLNKAKLCGFIKNAGYSMIDEWDSFDKMSVKTGLLSEDILVSSGILFELIDVL